MNRRLFAALVPSEAAHEQLHGWLATPEAELPEGWRMTTPESWHVTLVFMAAVDGEAYDPLVAALATAAMAYEPIALSWQSPGAFPSKAGARVLWIGVEDHADRLPRLARACRRAARAAGAEPDDNRFRGHLTLARASQRSDVREYLERQEPPAGHAWIADRIELIESRLGKGAGGRPAYDTLETFLLGAPQPGPAPASA